MCKPYPFLTIIKTWFLAKPTVYIKHTLTMHVEQCLQVCVPLSWKYAIFSYVKPCTQLLNANFLLKKCDVYAENTVLNAGWHYFFQKIIKLSKSLVSRPLIEKETILNCPLRSIQFSKQLKIALTPLECSITLLSRYNFFV